MGFSGSLSDLCISPGIIDLDHNHLEHPTNGIGLSWNNWMYELKKKKKYIIYI